MYKYYFFFFSSRRRHTRCYRDWSSDVCSSDLAVVRRAAPRRQLDLAAAGEVRARERGGVAIHRLWRPLRDDLAAVGARARAEVHDPVGLRHRLLVVLDDDHGVADVAEALQRREQLAVVALVQPDRRLVEDVDDAGELGAHLRGEADPLALAARERRPRALEGEVPEADVEEELEPVADLLQELVRDLRLVAAQVERREPGVRLLDDEPREIHDAVAVDLDGAALRQDPRPRHRGTLAA